MKKKNENLNELLAKFYDGQTASEMAENIIAGDRIFDSNPAPRPSPELLAEIKQNMFAAIQKNRQHSYNFSWQYAAIAAMIIIVFGTAITLLNKPVEQIRIYASNSFWQDASISVENGIDSQLADLESSETDSHLLTLEADASPEMASITDISSELDDIDATFWEG